MKLTSPSDSLVDHTPKRSVHDRVDLAGTEQFVESSVLNLKATFNALSINNIESIRTIYTSDIVFIDPFVKINGIDNLVDYFSNHYSNLQECRFDYAEEVIVENRVHLEWCMSFRHPRLSGGKQIDVDGLSAFVFERDGVSFHRDYFDSSALLYQNIPVLRSVIKLIRGRLS